MEPDVLARILDRATFEFALMRPMIPTYIHLLVSALFPIYAGAHASLTRPSSAAKPTKRTSVRSKDDEGSEDEDEDEEESHMMEGLSPTDAIVMPVLAGCTLAGLYFLLKWLGDAKLLNKFLNAYFAIFAVFSVARLVTDALDIGHSIIFPRRYALGGALYHVDGKTEKATPVAGNIEGKEAKSSPLPGFLARISLSQGFREWLWSDRAMPKNKWTIRMYLHRVFAGKALIGAHGIAGFVVSVLSVAYFNFVDKPWFLTNLMGFGFSYGALQLMSPTTFSTGSLILSALFFYDIYFVFYTPMMVTVAKSLDVPIKLVFPRPAPPNSTSSAPSHAMLGLGDVVLPGIMIGLALRFDLYMFYLKKQKRARTAGKEGEGETVEKPRYFSLAGRWSDHFWTHTLFGRPLFKAAEGSEPEAPFTFPKTYFKASIAGYVLGMLATLGVMQVWGHAQPALLYLVPGVLGSLWLTALARGELGMMWEFSEAEEEDESEAKDGKKGDKDDEKDATPPSRTSFFSLSDKKSEEREARMKKSLGKHITFDGDSEDESTEKDGSVQKKSKVKDAVAHKSDREVFSFSIEAPWKLKHPRSVRKKSEETVSDNVKQSSPKHQNSTDEPVGKRIRLE